jgi:hypothetical protein
LAELSRFRTASDRADLSYRSRWELVSHFLHHVEELPEDEATLGESQELVEMCLDTAQTDVESALQRLTDSTVAIVSSASASEAEMLRIFIERPQVPISGFSVAPHRRVLDYATHRTVLTALQKNFGQALQGPEPAHVGRAFLLPDLKQRLLHAGIMRAYFIDPDERSLSVELDVRLLDMTPEEGAPHYAPAPTFWCTAAPFAFALGFSKERTLMLGALPSSSPDRKPVGA